MTDIRFSIGGYDELYALVHSRPPQDPATAVAAGPGRGRQHPSCSPGPEHDPAGSLEAVEGPRRRAWRRIVRTPAARYATHVVRRIDDPARADGARKPQPRTRRSRGAARRPL